MTPKERDIVVARLISGCCRVEVENDAGKNIVLIAKQPSRYHRYIAQEIYETQLKEFVLQGSYTDDELLTFLLIKNIWDEEKQAMLDQLIKDVDEFKYKMFNLAFKSVERNQVKKYLDVARAEINRLFNIRNGYNHLSASGCAEMAKARYLIATGLHYLNGEAVYTSEEEFWLGGDTLIENVVKQVNDKRLNETEVRELARNEPWRSIWNCRKAEGQLFGISPVDFTDEQRMLCVWSGIYDSIYEHPDAPNEDVIEDDDLIDGWMIHQKKERERGQIQKGADSIITNEKIKNCGEIFIPVNNVEDARKVDAMNDGHSSITKRKRMNLLRQKGIVNETEMPDSKQKIEMEMAKARGIK